jgi:hypothetical protein
MWCAVIAEEETPGESSHKSKTKQSFHNPLVGDINWNPSLANTCLRAITKSENGEKGRRHEAEWRNRRELVV